MNPPASLTIDGQVYTFDKLITHDQIDARLTEMAATIDATDFPDSPPIVITTLNGALPLRDMLLPKISRPIERDRLHVSSYAGRNTTGEVNWLVRPRHQLSDRHVIVLEDIVDTGTTMDAVLRELGTENPASLRVLTLLHKPSRTKIKTDLWQIGFTIADDFAVGFGLDYDQQFRELPDIYRLLQK